MYSKSIYVLISIIICLVNFSSSLSNKYLYSVVSNLELPTSSQILNVVDATTGSAVKTVNMNLPSMTVIGILSVNDEANTVYLLCFDIGIPVINSHMVEYDVNTNTYNILASIPSNGEYHLQPTQVTFVEKTAFLFIFKSITYQIDVLSLNFGELTSEIIQLHAPAWANGPIQMGFDYQSNSMVITYTTTSNYVNLITLNATVPNANTTETIYSNIQNVNAFKAGLVFSVNGTIFILNDSVINGYYSICKVTLGSQNQNTCDGSLVNANIGNGPFTYVPFFLSNDHSSLITLQSNQFSPTLLTFNSFDINSNFKQISSSSTYNSYNSNSYQYQIYVSFAY